MKESVLTVGMCALAFACFAQVPTTTPSPSTQPLTVGPITYFENHCARCHGSRGSGYLPESMKRHDADALKKLIRDMSLGPAQAPLEGADLDAQFAYHQSLLNKSPFIAITGRTNKTLSGEATPGATLRLQAADETLDVPLDDFTWSIAIEGLNLLEARLILELDSEKVMLPLSEPFSGSTSPSLP